MKKFCSNIICTETINYDNIKIKTKEMKKKVNENRFSESVSTLKSLNSKDMNKMNRNK